MALTAYFLALSMTWNQNKENIWRSHEKQPLDVFSKSSFSILFVCLHTVVNCTWSCCQICFSNNFNLIRNFFWSPVFYMFKYTGGIKTRDNKPTLVVLIVPPVEKRFKRLASGINGPVELRSKVIQPSFIQPFLKGIVGYNRFNCRRIFTWSFHKLTASLVTLESA